MGEIMNCFELQKDILNILKKTDFGSNTKNIIIDRLNSIDALENQDKKLTVEQALREVMIKNYINDIETVEKIVKLSMELAKEEIVSAFFPVSLLVDVFDIKTLDFCEKLFIFVENNVSIFKEPCFFTPCKNSLLRMCNDLLRRLSRSQNTVQFSGRILMFLAKFFPFSERSGLNIVSEFNIENTTEFEFLSNESTRNNEDMIAETGAVAAKSSIEDESAMKVDRHLYLKFWALQDFFRCPFTCYDEDKFKKFSHYTSDVLAAFKSFKLEESGMSENTYNTLMNDLHKENENSDHFFAKFLTNPKLLALQLGDSNFRRTILVQYLIIFQYLVSNIKFKGENDKLNAIELDWVRDTESTVYTLLEETPPKGKEFSEAIKHILKREELWNNWKNDGCKEIKRPDGFDNEMPPKKKQKLLGELIADATKVGKFELGNQELSRLWNLCPDNLQACKGSDRNFLPPLEIYLDNKEIGSEKLDPTYEWRALRLVSRQSSHFFTLLAPHEKAEKISDYLKLFHQKIQKDKIEVKQEVVSISGIEISEQTETFIEEGETNEASDENDIEDENQHKITRATREQILEISKAIGSNWQKLGAKLGFEKDVLEYLITKNPDTPGETMLTNWFDEDDDASLENLVYTLEGLDLMKAVSLIKKMIDVEETMEAE